MFNATRVAAIVAALALTGSLAYVALPTAGPAVAPGAALDATDFAGFSGTFKAEGCVDGETTLYDWGHTVDGSYCSPMTIDVSDERMNGIARALHNGVRFKNGPVYGVRTLSADVSNDGGTWVGTGLAFHDPNDKVMRYELLLAGHGDYEGLSAMLSLVSDEHFLGHEARGVIFPGELPPYPVLDGVDEPITWTGEIDPADYAGFTSEATIGGAYGTGQSSLGDFGTQVREALYWDMAVESTDPRMTGIQESVFNYDTFAFQSPGRVQTSVERTVNDDGAWTSTSWGYEHPETGALHVVSQATGTGELEGLSAISITSTGNRSAVLETDGVIFPGQLPPYPGELPPAE